MKTVRIITPTGHLGTTPLEKGSFERGCAASPDFIVADSGSADIGPYPLGADQPASDEVWQRHDIEAMLLAARRLGIPLILGSASDTGTDRGVDQYRRLVREIVAEQPGVEEVSRPTPSSSPFADSARAGAWGRAISSALSNTRRCSTSRSPERRPRAARRFPALAVATVWSAASFRSGTSRGDQGARTTSPPTITTSARMSGSACSGAVSASWSRTAMSASLPSSRVPLSSSSKVR